MKKDDKIIQYAYGVSDSRTAKIITQDGEILTKEYYLRSSTGTDLATLDMTKNKLTWYVHSASRIAHFEHTGELPQGWFTELRDTKAVATPSVPQRGMTVGGAGRLMVADSTKPQTDSTKRTSAASSPFDGTAIKLRLG
jgi:hypothetical protein